MPPAERPIGNLRQRPNGNWQSQARQPGNGRLISKTWRTTSKAEARRLHAQWIADVIGGRAGAAGPTLGVDDKPAASNISAGFKLTALAAVINSDTNHDTSPRSRRP